MFCDVRHLLAGSWEFGIFLAGSNAVADEKQTAGMPCFASICWIEGCSQHPEGAGVRNFGIFNPEVGLGFGDNKRLEIQVVQAAVGDDEYLRVFCHQ